MYPTGKINTIFFKNRCPTSRIRHEKKNRTRQHTIFRNYCRYYSRHDCSNDIVILMSGSYCRSTNIDDCSDDCSNDIVVPMLGSYCRYYSHHAIVITTVVTTVATENRMPTLAIFFLIYGCPMSGTVFKTTTMHRSRSAPLCIRAASQKRWRMCVVACLLSSLQHLEPLGRAGSSRILGTL